MGILNWLPPKIHVAAGKCPSGYVLPFMQGRRGAVPLTDKEKLDRLVRWDRWWSAGYKGKNLEARTGVSISKAREWCEELLYTPSKPLPPVKRCK